MITGGYSPPFLESFSRYVESQPQEAAWNLKDGDANGARVAPWAMEEGKKDLQFSLVGFLKSSGDGLCRSELWLATMWREMPIRLFFKRFVRLDALCLRKKWRKYVKVLFQISHLLLSVLLRDGCGLPIKTKKRDGWGF